MGAPQKGLNPTTHSVGLTSKLVTVRSVSADGLTAVTVDRQNTETRVPMLVQRSKGPLPAVGDTWLLTQDLGMWAFAAFVGQSQSDFSGGGSGGSSGAAIIVSAQPPANPATGQLWMSEAEANELFQWTGSAWIGLQFGASALAPGAVGTAQLAGGAVTSAQIAPNAGILASQVAFSAEQIGGIQVFVQTTEPGGAVPGALWFDEAHDNEVLIWNGNTWDPLLLGPGAIAPSSLTSAQLAAEAGILASQVAFSFRDLGGTQTTIASIEPPNPGAGDLWFDGTNGYALKQWSGIAWLPYQFSTEAIAVGSITTELLAAGIIYAGIINGTQVNAAVFTGSVFEGIDFRLSQNGLFFYSGVPNLGNLLAGFVAPAGAGTDDFGNTVPGMLTAGPNGSGQVVVEPNINQPFNVTSAITGVLMGVVQLFSGDAAQLMPGMLGSVLLGSGTGAKMSSVLHSPFGAEGAMVLLESQNDGATDTPVITLGTVSMPDGTTMVYTPIMTLTPYAVVIYSSGGGQTITTKTSGSGTIPVGAATSVKAEAWGPGGGSSGTGVATSYSGGGGGGGYSCEPALAVSGTVAYSVGAAGSAGAAAGNGGNAANSTVTGTSVTVTAHGGSGGTYSTVAGSAAAGGAASANTIAFKGGNGAAGQIPHLLAPIGGGGGSSAGTAANGNNASANTPGAAPAGGGIGGAGGFGGASAANPGGAPGGGAGSAGVASSAGAAGGASKIRITIANTPPTVGFSINFGAAFTDQFGTTIPAGTSLATPAGLTGQLPVSQTDVSTQTNATTSLNAMSKIWPIPANDPKVGTVYRLTVWGDGTQGSTQESPVHQLAGLGTALANRQMGASTIGVSAAFSWKYIVEARIVTTGVTGTVRVNTFFNWSQGQGSGSGVNSNTANQASADTEDSAAINTTTALNMTAQIGWAATTGGPTLTSLGSMLERLGP